MSSGWKVTVSFFIAIAHAAYTFASEPSSSHLAGSNLAAGVVDDDPPCRLYLATEHLDSDDEESKSWTLFAGINYKQGDVVGGDDLIVLIDNANKNEYSPWHNLAWNGEAFPPAVRKSRRPTSHEASQMPIYHQDVFLAGLGCLSACASDEYHPNIVANSSEVFVAHELYESEPDAMSNIRNHRFVAKRDIQAGELLVLACDEEYNENQPAGVPPALVRRLEDLNRSGACVDAIQVKDSTIEGAGRGAFARRFVAKNEAITISPVAHVDRSQTEIVRQSYYADEKSEQVRKRSVPLKREHGIKYTSQVIGRQLLLNYLYGHSLSNVQLLPLGPGVNFINHDSDRPNVSLRWSRHDHEDSIELRETTPVMELFELPAPGPLVLEYVALEDILPGDELLMDYGPAYAAAWASRIDHSIGDVDTPPFRHEIGVPTNLYPQNWMRADPKPFGDFIASPLPPGQMAPIRWTGSAEVVSPWAFRVGLHSRVAAVLLDYCNKMGITEVLRHVTTEGNGLEPDTETHMDLEGDDWYMQRPGNEWRSNLHWFSPGAGPAHEHYLQALSVAGFDEILNGIGEYLGMDGLVAFHVTFIGVSFSTRGFLHNDVTDTDGKVYNVIIPLILANETGPELDLKELRPDLPVILQEEKVGRYRYEYNVATMMGDAANHATSACDYRNTKEMRMAATVYVADVNDLNAPNILNHYTQAYPPRDVELLKSWSGRHWKKGDPTRKLPKPDPDHILVRDSVSTGRSASAEQSASTAPAILDDEEL
jgi:hypothetical protein